MERTLERKRLLVLWLSLVVWCVMAGCVWLYLEVKWKSWMGILDEEDLPAITRMVMGLRPFLFTLPVPWVGWCVWRQARGSVTVEDCLLFVVTLALLLVVVTGAVAVATAIPEMVGTYRIGAPPGQVNAPQKLQ